MLLLQRIALAEGMRNYITTPAWCSCSKHSGESRLNLAVLISAFALGRTTFETILQIISWWPRESRQKSAIVRWLHTKSLKNKKPTLYFGGFSYSITWTTSSTSTNRQKIWTLRPQRLSRSTCFLICLKSLNSARVITVIKTPYAHGSFLQHHGSSFLQYRYCEFSQSYCMQLPDRHDLGHHARFCLVKLHLLRLETKIVIME